MINGVNSKLANIRSACVGLITNSLSAISAKIPQFLSSGKNLISGLVDGVRSEASALVSAARSIVDDAKSAISNKISEWTSIGSNMISGLIGGIKSMAGGLVESAKGVVDSAIRGAKNLLGIHSPSKVFAEIGRYVDEGFIVGLEKYAGKVVAATEGVGSSAIDGMTNAISGISNLIENGIDTEPTIRPVLDLSSVETGTKRLSTMFSRTQALSISSGMNKDDVAEIQNGMAGFGKGNTYQFTQNNYSPKALSRIEIYRQTKNQFSAMERMVEA